AAEVNTLPASARPAPAAAALKNPRRSSARGEPFRKSFVMEVLSGSLVVRLFRRHHNDAGNDRDHDEQAHSADNQLDHSESEHLVPLSCPSTGPIRWTTADCRGHNPLRCNL